MDPPPGNLPPLSKKPRRENQIQGQRPSPIKINIDSHKTKKPPIAPKNPNQPQFQPTINQPIIIYSVSPKPIMVDASNFRSIVQHLTGRDSTASESSFAGEVPVSPAARFASIERTSPGARERREKGLNPDDILDMMKIKGEEADKKIEENDGFLDLGQFPGILSPAPANLPMSFSTMFSPANENQLGFGFGGGMNDLNPFLSNTSFLPSPSALFFNAPLVSPSPSSPFSDLFNIFDF
ncbi:unnamed protein product [Amaranthus hypochondriacus]